MMSHSPISGVMNNFIRAVILCKTIEKALVWSLAILGSCESQTKSVSNTRHRSEKPNPEGFTTGENNGWEDTGAGKELVDSALGKLRAIKVSTVAQDRPSGVIGYALHYAKRAFYLLFMNGPSLDNESRNTSRSNKLLPELVEAIHELEMAAETSGNADAMLLLADMNFYGNFSHPRNFKEAFRWYQELASATGNSTAQYMVGFMYATGIGDAVERDQGMALLYHTFAAEQGNTRSEMTLAFRHHVGIGCSRDCDQAVHYYKQVADKAIDYLRSGPPGGRVMVRESYRWVDDDGGIYGEGASFSSSGPNAHRDGGHSSADANLEDVLEYLDLLSKKGELKATLSLGKMHYDGARTLPRNYRKAMKYFRGVTKKYWTKDGDILANHPMGIEKVAAKAAGYIGMMYLRGEGVEQSFTTAMLWFKRGLASGDALCQYEIGLMYLHGYGVPKDTFRAAEYFKAAAEQDFPAAQTRFGALFLDQGDVQTATKYFELAARWGWMEAFYYLAEIVNFGVGRERHCGMASAYYKMVAERAEEVHSSFIEANDAYEKGDRETALIAVMMAAEQGYENAQANVAYLLDEQRSVFSLDRVLPWTMKKPRPSLLRNAALALIYWTRSARQSNIDSLLKMGDYYLGGLGIPADPEKASTCYHTAAEGHHSAQAFWNLGWMHENGVAVEQDFHMAKRYYDLALATNQEAYFPVKLSLIKLRIRHLWNRITNGNVNPIQDEKESKAPRTFKEWVIAFLENDEEEAQQYAQLLREREEEAELLGTHHHNAENDDTGYYDELELDIDEIYIRQQRNRQRDNRNGQQQQAGANANNNNNGNGNNDRGFFPRPDQPEFAQMSQPPSHQAKRRRLDNTASALLRPFKSPLPKSAQRKEPATPDEAATTSNSNLRQQIPSHPHKPATPITPSSPSLNIKTSNPESKDPEILFLRKKRLTLQSQLTSLRTELDTAQQALRIESSSRDDELRALRLKWRGISQKAAEELFETAKEKIGRMGGVAAWRESERQRVKRMAMWEDDEFYAGGDGEEDDGEREKGDDGFDDYEEERSGEKEGDEEEMFTMDMMLKSLNIEPDIIGFDIVEKRWKSD
ncbi:Tetratricopeptide-like helical [Penicillium occitanis (nom. inval.)]|nr:Tetratricopeptide-like helical [Penicillium occitanis (nom. inval.)]PCG98600.1 hypothetical protein PENOC_062300 [Penicillium occitanis (nom. inval.)]